MRFTNPPRKPEQRPDTGPDSPTTMPPAPVHDPDLPSTTDPTPPAIGDPEAPPTGTEPNRFNDHAHDEAPDETNRSWSSLSGDVFMVEPRMHADFGDENQSWEEELAREAVEDSPEPDLMRRP